MQYYVYILKRPDGSPFYVGKGKCNRWKSHERRAMNKSNTSNDYRRNIIRKILRSGGRVHADLYLCNNEQHALIVEKFMIKELRLKYRLANHTDGGDGISGFRHSKKTKKLISLKKKGSKLPPHSEEAKRKISLAHIGMKASPEARKKMSLAKLRNPVLAFLNYKKTPEDLERRRLSFIAGMHKWAEKRSKVQIEFHAKRRAKGILHFRAKLTPKLVLKLRKIRELKKLSFVKLGEMFNISTTLAQQVVKRQAWGWVI